MISREATKKECPDGQNLQLDEVKLEIVNSK